MYQKVKTITSFIVALLLLPILVPIILVFAVLIMLENPGNPIYKQERIGLNGKKFYIYKLRSMIIDAEKEGAIWAQTNDKRVTTIGKFIRKTRIDELPQIWNILNGDMHIIGPRPEREVFIHEFLKLLPDFNDRLVIKPGITGWAQVNGGYDLSVYEKLKYDKEYIAKCNFLMDVKILLLTIRVVLTGHGAR